MATKLTTTLSQGFSKGLAQFSGEGSILIEQVDDTSCDNILVDVFVGSKVTDLSLDTTLGSLVYSGTAIKNVTERISFSGTSSSTFSNPGVSQVHSFDPIGKVKRSDDTGDYEGRTSSLTNFVYDADTTSIQTSNGQNVYAVLEVNYTIIGKRYKYKWPAGGDDLYAMIFAEGKDGFPKASLEVDRENCEVDAEDIASGVGFAPDSGDTQQIYTLNMLNAFSAAKMTSTTEAKLGALFYVYPFPDTRTPTFVMTVDDTDVVELNWELEATTQKDIDEVAVFNSNGISNMSIFPTSTISLTITPIGVMYDSDGNVLIPSFRKPGDQVLLQNATGFTTGTQRLGPTEIAVVNAGNALVSAVGSVRLQYKVPMKAIRVTSFLPMTRERLQKWQVKMGGTLLYTTGLSAKPVFFRGESSIQNPFGNVQVARDKLTEDLIAQFAL